MIVVVPQGMFDITREALIADAVVVEGGDNRRESVGNGLRLVETETVIVHDAVRPLVTAELVDRVLTALDDAEAAVPAVAMEETIKRAVSGKVTETLDRSTLWRVQTPQAFRTSALVEAHERAHKEGFEPTDDAQLVEWCGGRVVIVPGDPRNIKITWPVDFEIAEALLRMAP